MLLYDERPFYQSHACMRVINKSITHIIVRHFAIEKNK